jgi:sugar lactone lactonase YvrE
MSAVLALALTTGAGGLSRADVTLFATSLEGKTIQQVDITNNTQTTLFQAQGNPDSLIFTTTGNIVYTDVVGGHVYLYNTTTQQFSTLASGLSSPQDLQLSQDGTAVYFSDTGHNQIDKVSLSGGPVNVLHTYGANTTGLALDGAGNLYAAIGGVVDQIDPTTGAILHAGSTNVGADGLTFDAGTGLLYASSFGGSTLYSINPTTLVTTQLANVSGLPNPDGIENDGGNNLYIASRGNGHIYTYNLTSQQLTQNTFVSGLDDLAPASGLGSNAAATPEPSTLVSSGLGVLMALSGLWWKRRRSSR